MTCLICSSEILEGEKIFGGCQGVSVGKDSWSFSDEPGSAFGSIHMVCLKRAAGANSGPMTGVCEPDKTELVTRSDALSVFGI